MDIRSYCMAVAFGFLLASGPLQAGELYRWVQFTPGGIEARAVTDAETCPPASVDGMAVAMAERAAPGADFPVRACSLRVPKQARTLAIAGLPLPLPKARPDRILLIGDTGCRLNGKKSQACNDMSEWPFRLNADMSAAFKPDLVLHVGDMLYREDSCPLGNQGCAGTPFGDSWPVWREDFFKPGEALLGAAPWIMVRGNHEECERGGKGWARMLDPYRFDPATGARGCLGPARPYTVDLGGVTLVVLDVSTAAEKKVNAAEVAWYKPQFELGYSISGPVWFAFHRPIWSIDSAPGAPQTGDNRTLAAAARDAFSGNVTMLLSGHHHTFEAMTYAQDLPLQIVSGHGGDVLAKHARDVVKGLEINGVTVRDGLGRPHIFGFSMLERVPADTSGQRWVLTGYDSHGHPIGRCEITGRQANCQ